VITRKYRNGRLCRPDQEERERQMHANVLRYFVEVVRCGSIRRASQNLFIASSAINRHLLNLEDELQAQLFDRLPGGIRLTPAGERLLKHIQGTIHDYQLMRADLDKLKGENTGHINLVAIDSLFLDFLPRTIDQFSEFYPRVTYSLSATPVGNIAKLVAKGEADVGISYLEETNQHVEVLASIPLPPGLVMLPSHPFAKRRQVSLDACEGQSFVLFSRSAPPLHAFGESKIRELYSRMNPSLVSNYTPLLKRMILQGRGITIASKIAFLDEISRGDLVWRPLDSEALNNLEISVVVTANRDFPSVTHAFIELQIAELKRIEQITSPQ
jgi:DNA-binding transcriptional LysR family regulator